MWLPSGACAYPVQSCCLCLSSNPRTDFFPQRSRECRPEYKHGVQAGRKERQLSSQWQKTVQDLGFQSYHESRPVAKRIAESRRRRATARASKLDLSSNIQRTRKEKRDTSIEDRHAELTERNQEIRMLIGNIAHTKSGDSTMKSLERKKEKRKERQKRKSKSSSSSSSASGRSSGSESSDEEKTKRRNKGGKAQLDPPVTIGHSGDSNGPQVKVAVCNGSKCRKRKAEQIYSKVLSTAERICEEDPSGPSYNVRYVKCLGKCDKAPNVMVRTTGMDVKFRETRTCSVTDVEDTLRGFEMTNV